MRWRLMGLVLVAAVGLAEGAEREQALVWHSDYAAARELARQSGRPLFVVFRCEH